MMPMKNIGKVMGDSIRDIKTVLTEVLESQEKQTKVLEEIRDILNKDETNNKIHK